jgi:hypothetical protein
LADVFIGAKFEINVAMHSGTFAVPLHAGASGMPSEENIGSTPVVFVPKTNDPELYRNVF